MQSFFIIKKTYGTTPYFNGIGDGRLESVQKIFFSTNFRPLIYFNLSLNRIFSFISYYQREVLDRKSL